MNNNRKVLYGFEISIYRRMYLPVLLDTDEEPHEGRTLVLAFTTGSSMDAIADTRVSIFPNQDQFQNGARW